jgi:protein SCO1/2
MKKLIGAWSFIIFLFCLSISYPKDLSDKVGIDQQLGKTIPLDAVFYDSKGNEVTLRKLINKPTVIDFAYYKCTGICTPLMTEVADVMNRVDLKPGKDYQVITISFDENELPKDAAEKKAAMTNLLNSGIPVSSWWFLTGDSTNIRKVTNAAGFHFERQGNTFLHIGILMFVSKDGKICRYLEPGFNYKGNFRILPLDFKMALLDASKGQAIPVIDKALRYCFSYQPKNKSYVLDVFKISGVSIVVMVTALFFFVIRKPKKDSKKIS